MNNNIWKWINELVCECKIGRNEDAGIDVEAKDFQEEAEIKSRLTSYKIPNYSATSYIKNFKYHLVFMSGWDFDKFY